MNPSDPPDTSTSNSPTDSDDAHPPYTHLEPSCPVCGNSRFSSTDEGIPHGYDAHYVHVTCANCRTVLTIEYRAIDLSWTDGHDERHSAVSHGLLTPTQTTYGDPLLNAPLPDTTVLRGLDWPIHCEECTEPLTGNDLLSEPPDRDTDDSEEAEPPQALFECLTCGHRTTYTCTGTDE
jgi:transcription elongation factor Elf1